MKKGYGFNQARKMRYSAQNSVQKNFDYGKAVRGSVAPGE